MRRSAYTSGFFKNGVQQQHISHHKLLEKINIHALSRGVCFGVACVGAQAILTKQVTVFDRMCDQLEKDTRGIKNRNMRDLLQKICFYQRPALFGISSLQNTHFAMHSFSLLTNHHSSKQARNLINTRGAYSSEELETYFKLIGDLVAKVDHSLAIIFGNAIHAITVGYERSAKQWYFIDVNQLPSKKMPLDELAYRVSYTLADFDNIIISGNLFSLERDVSKFYSALYGMLHKKEWQAIHELTVNKTRMRDVHDNSLLDLAMSENDNVLISTLKSMGM